MHLCLKVCYREMSTLCAWNCPRWCNLHNYDNDTAEKITTFWLVETRKFTLTKGRSFSQPCNKWITVIEDFTLLVILSNCTRLFMKLIGFQLSALFLFYLFFNFSRPSILTFFVYFLFPLSIHSFITRQSWLRRPITRGGEWWNRVHARAWGGIC